MASKSDLSNYRKSYKKNSPFNYKDCKNPLDLFNTWFNDFDNDDSDSEVNAMSLSTVGVDGFPKSRVVLLKEYNQDGFIFYTNYNSEKGVSIDKNNKVCLSFFWEQHERQVIIKGYAKKLSNSKSIEYFNSRPRGSKLGAIVSNQSSIIESKSELVDNLLKLDKKYSKIDITKPSHWGGYIVSAVEFEFWQGGENRLHDRARFKLLNKNWIKDRLSP